MMYGNNSFSRTRNNEACAGAYYTDLSHASSIGELLIWPTEGKVACLEPSIGDGNAVCECVHPERNPVEIYGIELNDAVAKQTEQKEGIKVCIPTDFTSGCMIRRNAFSLCFANPPYLESRGEDGTYRMEDAFLERIINYLRMDGVLIWIVSYSNFMANRHTRMWMCNFETLAAYKFRKSEYEKFHQIVFIGKKKLRKEVLAPQVAAFQETYHLDCLEELPLHPEPRIPVPVTPKEVDMFTTRHFDESRAYHYLSVNGIGVDVVKHVGDKIFQPAFIAGELLRPPIPPKKDSLYLLATSGCGQGLAGSEENGDLHLQRGVAEVVETTRYNDDGEEDGYSSSTSSTMTVTSRTAITMTIIENSGKIVKLT